MGRRKLGKPQKVPRKGAKTTFSGALQHSCSRV